MEKDITILKSLIEDLKREEKLIGYDAEVEIQAIETLIETNKKLENKLMYALSPTTHELSINTQEHFKAIIRDNLEEDTYTIKRVLKEYWKTFK